MAEMTEQTPAATQQATLTQTQVAEKAGNILSGLGPFLSEKDRIALQKEAGIIPEQVQQQEAPAQQQENDQEGQPETPAAEQGATEQPAATEGEKEAEKKPETKKSVLGLNKKKEKPSEVTIENTDQLLGVIKSKFGQELKDIKEIPKFFESADKWRANAQKFEETNANLEGLKNEIMNLPVEFHEAFKAFREGQDYTAPFQKRAGIDYTKPVEKQDIKALVNHYMPGEFQDSDFEETDKSKALLIAEKAVIEKFNVEKSRIDSERAGKAEQSKKLFEAQKIAAASSVKGLQERFPDMDDQAVNQVKSIIEGGPQKVLSLFFNNDGTAKPEAAIMATMALFGESELLPDAMEVAANIAETRKNEELLTRGADGPKPNRGGGQPEQLPEEIKKKIDEMTKIGNITSKKTF